MSNPEILNKLGVVFQDVFDGEEVQFSPRLVREDCKAWDSLGHIRLISGIEEAFGVSLTIDEIESVTSVERLVSLLSAKGQ